MDAKEFLEVAKPDQRWLYDTRGVIDLKISFKVVGVNSFSIFYYIEEYHGSSSHIFEKRYPFGKRGKWDRRSILKYTDYTYQSFDIIDSISGATCKVCGLVNEYVEEKEYICYNCRS